MKRAFLSWRATMVNSCSSASDSGGTVIPSTSESPTKDQVLVMARVSMCCVMMAVGVMHITRRYLPLQLCFVHRKRATQSGGICGSCFRGPTG